MTIPHNLELDTNLDKAKEEIVVSFRGDNGQELLLIRYGHDGRCLQNPETMRVITDVLSDAHIPVPLPFPENFAKCPKGHEVPGPKYFSLPCSPRIEPGVRYELLLQNSCGALPEFDGSFWDIEARQAKKHAHHIGWHHGFYGTVQITGKDTALFESKNGKTKIDLTRRDGGLAYIGCA